MNKHRRKPEGTGTDPARQEQKNNSRVTLRLLLALYLGYLIVQMVKGYRQEGDLFLAVAALFFTVVEAVIVIGSLRRWMREQQRINGVWADMAQTENPDEEELL